MNRTISKNGSHKEFSGFFGFGVRDTAWRDVYHACMDFADAVACRLKKSLQREPKGGIP